MIEVLLGTKSVRVVSGDKLVQEVIEKAGNHKRDQAVCMTWMDYIPILLWMLDGSLDEPKVEIDCILEYWEPAQVVDGKLDAHVRVVLSKSSFRGLVSVHPHLLLWDRLLAGPY